jgi:hypothetical protein
MISSELRIGNIVKQGIIESIGSSLIQVSDTIYESEIVEPIPLTEEWLFKFGFKLKYEYYEHNENYIEFWIVNGKIFCEYKGVSIYDNINYVHDLQNLHFAIYKRELKIK